VAAFVDFVEVGESGVRLPDASHWVHHDEAERVTQLLIDFFAPRPARPEPMNVTNPGRPPPAEYPPVSGR